MVVRVLMVTTAPRAARSLWLIRQPSFNHADVRCACEAASLPRGEETAAAAGT
jgi:hypothetical protein